MTATDRKRRQRKRERSGQIVVPVVVSNAIIAALIDLEWLLKCESENREQIGAAITRAFEDVAQKSVTRGHTS